MSAPLDVAPNDLLAYDSYGHFSSGVITVRVVRTTKTQVIDATGGRWRKRDGYRIGGHTHVARVATEQDKAAVREQRVRNNAARALAEINKYRKHATLEECAAIITLAATLRERAEAK